ncbi:MAG TPA: class I SAM-dependent methyltransferase [Candidatus Pullilachnospira intestinigallinarum]|nr:class I SAM-dependent methyltransferase [Candidatus Pullilachnospira intestinigallinarum]
MKENRYDDPEFFEKYSQMSRSVQGLSGAGEWPALEKMMPDVENMEILDLGCGYGWHCIYFSEKKAARITGVDLSEKMLQVARGKSRGLPVAYLRCAMEEVDFPENSFDMVFSSLAFHYVEDFDALAARVERMLKPGGIFLFSCEHPVFTAQGSQDWLYDEQGEIRCFPVDRYYYPGERDAIFLGEHVRKYHRTVTGYLKPLLKLGFAITDFEEPMPTGEARRTIPGMEDEMRRPMMMIVKAVKPEG